MAKKKNQLIQIILWLVGVIVSLGVGGLFVAGGFKDVVILNLLPLIIHQIVGWIVIGGTVLGLVLGLTEKLK